MIITKAKPEEELNEMLKPYEKLFVVGCGTCSTSCMTGGEEQVAEMVKKVGDRAIGSAVVEDPCDLRIARKELKEFKAKVQGADAVLVMSCGAGVQTVGGYSKKIVLAALNTLTIG